MKGFEVIDLNRGDENSNHDGFKQGDLTYRALGGRELACCLSRRGICLSLAALARSKVWCFAARKSKESVSRM